MNTKALINAPCGKMWDKGKMEYPSVICGEISCETCGWNPKEKMRRLNTGRWRKVSSRLNAETDEVITFTGKPEQLVFKRR